jgi:hypothetical protein
MLTSVSLDIEQNKLSAAALLFSQLVFALGFKKKLVGNQ